MASSPTPGRSRSTPRPRRWRHWARKLAPYAFISPFFILFAVFGLFPLLFSVVLSFNHWEIGSGLAGMSWVGLSHYGHLLLQDDWLRKALYNTLWIAIVAGVPQHLVALPLAYYMHTRLRRWRNLVAGAYFVPFITSTVAISLVFTTLFSREFGVVNAVLPGPAIDWTAPQYTKWMIAFVVFWRYVGWNAVLYLSALQTIPKDLLEAAAMDGASPRRQFFHIVLPMLRPMIFFAVTLTIIGNLQLFEEAFILTGGSNGTADSGLGGIDQAGSTLAMHLYWLAFTEGEFGTASALAWLLFALIAVCTWLNKRLLGGEAR
jgi:multiple sugar transport system permease protein